MSGMTLMMLKGTTPVAPARGGETRPLIGLSSIVKSAWAKTWRGSARTTSGQDADTHVEEQLARLGPAPLSASPDFV